MPKARKTLASPLGLDMHALPEKARFPQTVICGNRAYFENTIPMPLDAEECCLFSAAIHRISPRVAVSNPAKSSGRWSCPILDDQASLGNHPFGMEGSIFYDQRFAVIAF